MNKKLIFGIVLGIALVFFSAGNINFQETITHIKNVDPGPAGLSLFFIVFMQALRSYRWGVILAPLGKISHLSVFAVTNVGFLAICAIPARLGELARPYLIAQKSPVRMSSALGTIVVERALDALAIVVITVCVLMLHDLPAWMVRSGIVFFVLTILLIAFMIFLIMRREAAHGIIDRLVRRLPDRAAKKIKNIIRYFTDGIEVITDIKRLFYLLILSALIWLVDVAAIYALLIACGFHLPVLAPFVVMIVLIAGIAIPAAPGFIGNWHFACILALSLFGIAKAEALSFALVYHFLSIAVVIVLGVLSLPFNRFSIAEMTKKMNQEG
ncbi:MAG: flippase-like domain-containing protein [Smithella sp.]|nr:flippase-like domain-containing protein [Smithella sp.]